MPAGWYNRGVFEVVSGNTNLETSDIKAMLLKTTGSFDRDNTYVSDIVANEVSVTGYARVSLTNPALSQNNTLDAVYLTADDPVFGPMDAGQTVRYMVLFRDTGSDATSPLLMCWQVVDFPTDGTEYEFPFSVNGVSKFWSAT